IRRTSGSSLRLAATDVRLRRANVVVALMVAGSFSYPILPSQTTRGNPKNASGRQLHAERAALALGALHGDRAAHQVHVAFDDGQSQPGVQAVRLAGRVDPVEALEDVLAHLGRDADAGVADFQVQVAVLPRYGHLDAAVGAVVLDGVVQQVGDHLAELVAV